MKNLKKYLIMIMLTSMGYSSCQFQGQLFSQQEQKVTLEPLAKGVELNYNRDSGFQMINKEMDTILKGKIAKYEVHNRLERMSSSSQAAWAVLVSLVIIPGMLEYAYELINPLFNDGRNNSFQESGNAKNKRPGVSDFTGMGSVRMNLAQTKVSG